MIRGLIGGLRAKLEGNSDPKLEEELPYAAMMITLMAASGVSPYESFRRLRSVDALERFREEGDQIVRQVEVLGNDPLTAMERRSDETKSKAYSEFLEGYVSSVKSGGSIVAYLTSKLRGIFDLRAARAQHDIERLETLVEGYMIMLIVIFSFYILSMVTSTASAITMSGGAFPDTSAFVYPLVLFVIPLFSVFFTYIANNIRPSTLRGMKKIYVLGFAPFVVFAAVMAAIMIVPQLSFIQSMVEPSLIMTAGLVAISVPPSITYMRIARKNFSAENAMPSFLRDVTEARRTGLPPEKSIIHAARRRGYGPFTSELRRIINQIEWGVSLRKIYGDLKVWIRSWPVIVDFLILVETIEIGGGDAKTLGILAEFSEKSQTIEKSQRDMLKPYVILPFVWTILMAFTITFTSYTMSVIPLALPAGGPKIPSSFPIIEAAIVFHTWLSGFFIGKVSEGNLASGFKYSAILALIAYVTLFLSKMMVGSIFRGLM